MLVDLQTRRLRQILLFLRNNSLAVLKLQTDQHLRQDFKSKTGIHREGIWVYISASSKNLSIKTT